MKRCSKSSRAVSTLNYRSSYVGWRAHRGDMCIELLFRYGLHLLLLFVGIVAVSDDQEAAKTNNSLTSREKVLQPSSGRSTQEVFQDLDNLRGNLSYSCQPSLLLSDHNLVASKTDSQTIYIQALFAQSGEDCSEDKIENAELAAAQLALQHINDQNVVPGYNLAMYVNNTQVSVKHFVPNVL